MFTMNLFIGRGPISASASCHEALVLVRRGGLATACDARAHLPPRHCSMLRRRRRHRSRATSAACGRQTVQIQQPQLPRRQQRRRQSLRFNTGTIIRLATLLCGGWDCTLAEDGAQPNEGVRMNYERHTVCCNAPENDSCILCCSKWSS
jgi:hypothetical protein